MFLTILWKDHPPQHLIKINSAYKQKEFHKTEPGTNTSNSISFPTETHISNDLKPKPRHKVSN